jgi:Core-2/I-Branching enzyme
MNDVLDNRYVDKQNETGIVYLILAHTAPTLLARLVNALDDSSVRFIIHVDAKADVDNFTYCLGTRENVRFLENRIDVLWGGYSMVEATLRLMEEASRDSPEFKYAVLLSGVHYPIKSNEYIREFFHKSSDEYLQFAKTCEVGCEHKTDAFCLYDYKLFNPRTVFFRNKWVNMLAKIPGKSVDILFSRIVSTVYKRKLPGGVIPYTGSNWWALTNPCVRYILEYVKENPRYISFFRLSRQPDEAFFHTIICNAGFKLANENISLAGLGGEATSIGKYSRLCGLSLTYTKCSKTGSPKVLDEDDFEEIRKELNFFSYPQLFARKVESDSSAGLLQLIDSFRR